ncbi:MAG: peptide chain release factor 2 [Spirochaetes bacterium]|nr:peptide chain release factor 2 [Spirochaetota bacterium]NLJ05258.1 peptide chain release factor 2 [Exilispira sp.]HOV45546.1 peptide chain release factor 2 [Exilispira sp.]
MSEKNQESFEYFEENFDEDLNSQINKPNDTSTNSQVDYFTLKKLSSQLYAQFKEIQNSIPLDKLEEQIAELNSQTQDEVFWSDQANAKKVLSLLNRLEKKITSLKKISNDFEDLMAFIEQANSSSTKDVSDIYALYQSIEASFKELIYIDIFNQLDYSNAFLTLKPGAGGLESTDWAQMLFKLYIRYAERKNFKVEVLELVPVEGGGIKVATLHIKGEYAYGFLKYETGIHRLVRISPFDSNARRHTSFASVYVFPELSDEVDVQINPSDIKIETFRAGGAGGQHINKTDSAVRIIHLPTRITVVCQNERSQHQNKETAMKVLKSRLYQYYLEEKKKKEEEIMAERKDISWGNQIRSYTLQPYTLIKDHRSKYESSSADRVLDGDIDDFIFAMISLDFKKKYNINY